MATRVGHLPPCQPLPLLSPSSSLPPPTHRLTPASAPLSSEMTTRHSTIGKVSLIDHHTLVWLYLTNWFKIGICIPQTLPISLLCLISSCPLLPSYLFCLSSPYPHHEVSFMETIIFVCLFYPQHSKLWLVQSRQWSIYWVMSEWLLLYSQHIKM